MTFSGEGFYGTMYKEWCYTFWWNFSALLFYQCPPVRGVSSSDRSSTRVNRRYDSIVVAYLLLTPDADGQQAAKKWWPYELLRLVCSTYWVYELLLLSYSIQINDKWYAIQFCRKPLTCYSTLYGTTRRTNHLFQMPQTSPRLQRIKMHLTLPIRTTGPHDPFSTMAIFSISLRAPFLENI